MNKSRENVREVTLSFTVLGCTIKRGGISCGPYEKLSGVEVDVVAKVLGVDEEVVTKVLTKAEKDTSGMIVSMHKFGDVRMKHGVTGEVTKLSDIARGLGAKTEDLAFLLSRMSYFFDLPRRMEEKG